MCPTAQPSDKAGLINEINRFRYLAKRLERAKEDKCAYHETPHTASTWVYKSCPLVNYINHLLYAVTSKLGSSSELEIS